jgi:hypothetical protein
MTTGPELEPASWNSGGKLLILHGNLLCLQRIEGPLDDGHGGLAGLVEAVTLGATRRRRDGCRSPTRATTKGGRGSRGGPPARVRPVHAPGPRQFTIFEISGEKAAPGRGTGHDIKNNQIKGRGCLA